MLPRDLIGHAAIWEFLARAVEAGELAHAYLFVGPKHVGKRHLADSFARYLLCAGISGPSLFKTSSPASARPCGQCPSCLAFQRGMHPDLLLLERTAEEQAISIESVRAFLSRLKQSPAISQRKLAIIDETESLTLGAANAFLKHLEEPTPTTTIVLIAHDQQRVLKTVVSRCQVLEFERVATMPPGAHEIAWKQCRGLPGLYKAYQQSPSLAQLAQDEQDRFFLLFDMNAGQRLALLDSLFTKKKGAHAQSKQEWDERLGTWMYGLRQAMVADAAGTPLNNIRLSPRMYIYLYDELWSLRRSLQQNINVRAHLERLLLSLPKRS